MTNHVPPPRPRRHPLLYVTLAVAILAAAWISHFLFNFDLNNYRQDTEEHLSSLLSLPVTIGDIHYNLNETQLALHIADMEIGTNDSFIQANAPNIMLNLKWRGLLERDFKFAKISATRPEIWVRSSDKGEPGSETPLTSFAQGAFDPDLLQRISVEGLKITDGTVHIETSLLEQPAQQIDLVGLDGELSDLRLDHAIQLALKGELKIPGQQEKSPWQLHGDSSLRLNKESGPDFSYNLDLSLKNLALATLNVFLANQLGNIVIKGFGDLHLQLEKKPETGLDFQSELSSKGIELSPSAAYSNPIRFKKLSVSGHLQTQDKSPGIKNLSLQVDESRLSGHLGWGKGKGPLPMTVTLIDSKLEINQLTQWLPEEWQAWQSIRQNIRPQGTVHIKEASFTLFDDKSPQGRLRIDGFNAAFRDITYEYPDTPALKITSLPLIFAGKRWQIKQAKIQWGSLPLTVSGHVEHVKDGTTLTSIDFTGEAIPEELLKEWQIPQHSLLTKGNVNFSGHLEGPLGKLTLDLQTDLSQFSLSHPDSWQFTPGPGDRLSLHATLSPNSISLDHGAIRWSVVNGHLSGSYPFESPDALTIDAFLKTEDLAKLSEVLPFLESLQLHGQADLAISQKGLPQHQQPEMTLTLRDAGLQATRHIADLSQINGRVQLTTTGLKADNLRVHLGESPLIVHARLEDFSRPRLLLDVEAASIHPDDLVFYSDQAVLRDVTGHLEIDGDGLTFAPVDVRLDGGTKASVRGIIPFHPPHNVQLDITSEFALISEVIGLWTDRSEKSKERSASFRDSEEDATPTATLKITASVQQGDLYGMSFHNATGIIIPTHNRLSIHPLDFSVGEGFCNAQVINDFSDEGITLLRISGHAHDVDALEVYRELLNQKNIVRGKLSGDFYLNGEVGTNYLPSSYGSFNIQVQNGVLHKFPFLSKVFSLLNVSQIFALQLPDMDSDGMPFNLLSANFRLREGILESDDLKIQSEAMNQSYIGSFNLIDKELKLSLAIHPLGTVDKIVSRIPVAGWLLTGEDKALLTAYFAIEGEAGDASVTPLPLGTLTEPAFGLLKRTLGLPFKLFEDPEILWGGEADKK